MQEENVEIELRSTLERPAYKLSVKLIDTYKFINKVSQRVNADAMWFSLFYELSRSRFRFIMRRRLRNFVIKKTPPVAEFTMTDMTTKITTTS